MQSIQEPCHKVHSISCRKENNQSGPPPAIFYIFIIVLTLFGNLEILLAAEHHSLQHLMGRNVSLEVSGIPKFAHELAKPLHQEEHDVPWWSADCSVVFLLQEIVPQRWNIGKGLGKRGKCKIIANI